MDMYFTNNEIIVLKKHLFMLPSWTTVAIRGSENKTKTKIRFAVQSRSFRFGSRDANFVLISIKYQHLCNVPWLQQDRKRIKFQKYSINKSQSNITLSLYYATNKLKLAIDWRRRTSPVKTRSFQRCWVRTSFNEHLCPMTSMKYSSDIFWKQQKWTDRYVVV